MFSLDLQEVGVYCLTVKGEVVGMLGALSLSLGDVEEGPQCKQVPQVFFFCNFSS